MTTVIIPTTSRPLLGSITAQAVMAEASQTGRWCQINASGQLIEAAGDDAATSTGMLVFLVAGSAQNVNGTLQLGETATFVSFGRVAMPGAALDPTADYYLSDPVSLVSGLMADAAGTVTRRLGRAEASEVFFVNPDIAEATSA